MKKKTVLIADDSPLSRQVLRNTLHGEYHVLEAVNGLEVINYLRSPDLTPDLILLDLVMPQMDGIQVLRHMYHEGLMDRIPVIVITAVDSEADISDVYDMGVSEVIQKPFNHRIIAKRVRNIVELYARNKDLRTLVDLQTASIQQQSESLRLSNEHLIDTLSTVIEYRSLESGQHIKRIRSITKLLLEQFNGRSGGRAFSPIQIEMISKASALHDVGKIAIPDSVLLKPGPLTTEEFEIMKTHPQKGAEIIRRLDGIDDMDYLSYCHEICLYHHERWDGHGYPEGLAGNRIPIAAQVVSVADAFDALTHTRVYKAPYSTDESAQMIVSGACGAFSPLILDCFLAALPQLKKLLIAYSDDLFNVI